MPMLIVPHRAANARQSEAASSATRAPTRWRARHARGALRSSNSARTTKTISASSNTDMDSTLRAPGLWRESARVGTFLAHWGNAHETVHTVHHRRRRRRRAAVFLHDDRAR